MSEHQQPPKPGSPKPHPAHPHQNVRRDLPRPPRPAGAPKKEFKLWKRPELKLQTTTHWSYPSQHYGVGMQGHKEYIGATPSWVIWNLLERYTREGDTVLDPMCGSGTTLDVCRDLDRQGVGF